MPSALEVGFVLPPLIFDPIFCSRSRTPAFTVSRVSLSTTWRPELLRVDSTWKNSRLAILGLSSPLPSQHRQVLQAHPMLLSGFPFIQKLIGTNYPQTPDFYLALPGRIPRAESPKQIKSQELSDALWTFSVGSLPSANCRYVKLWSLVNVNKRKTGTLCLFFCLHFGLLRWWDWQMWMWDI